jgi:hypothetical protein
VRAVPLQLFNQTAVAMRDRGGSARCRTASCGSTSQGCSVRDPAARGCSKTETGAALIEPRYHGLISPLPDRRGEPTVVSAVTRHAIHKLEIGRARTSRCARRRRRVPERGQPVSGNGSDQERKISGRKRFCARRRQARACRSAGRAAARRSWRPRDT